MRYQEVEDAVFLRRPNRFIATVLLRGQEETVHVKNTGRCRELLLPGARVILSRGKNPARKTRWDLVSVWKGDTLINMDSQAPNAAAAELLPRLYPGAAVTPEYTWGRSRFDFFLQDGERRLLLEVKGVTLEEDGLALFPDAPTQRGTKHLTELAAAKKQGYESAVLFLVQMKGCRAFRPNDATDPAFGRALREAKYAGVELLCYDCRITRDAMTADAPLPILLP
ncbi:MAG: DNA/RNA nuclease SfsA [Oscillospiraceae bacterium]|nr:DNA/RNA nuclease SfsA [Oscillospiraceae bacterium]